MKFFTIFLAIAALLASAESLSEQCQTDLDCYPFPPVGSTYYCDDNDNMCYIRHIPPEKPMGRQCSEVIHCIELSRAIIRCDTASKMCYKRERSTTRSTGIPCQRVMDCVAVPVGVKFICDSITKTCTTRNVD